MKEADDQSSVDLRQAVAVLEARVRELAELNAWLRDQVYPSDRRA